MSNERKSTLLLEHYLKQLKLPTILKEYPLLANSCSLEKCDYPTYLLRLCEKEVADRQRRAMDRRIQGARFPLLKTIDSFDFASQKSINEPLIRELLRCQFVDQHENVLLIGNSGTGKTHLATALGFAACCQGYKVRFFGCTALVTQLVEAREDRQLQRLLSQFEKQDLLILDELGYVPFSKLGSELLFEVVSRAYERQSLILTTNLPFENWTEVCGSERLTGAMLDRLTHKVHILEANGASYRLEQSRKRLARQNKIEQD
ncbi:MAG: IS21-like element helper ATPase IstB [Halothiobacillaceae bacterium]|jgi:DNA replication protein DnaC|nr:IS21-like element helper ATPase IstB [Halothiobacillaceae bacterium]